MADAFKTTWAGGDVLVPKAQVEAQAREACPYPFHTDAALHWLATFNLCIPLPVNKTPTTNNR